MQIEFSPDGSADALRQGVQTLAAAPDIRAILVFGCDENHWQPELLDATLQTAQVPILGGIFPQIIYRQRNYTQGFVLVGLNREIQWQQVDHLSEDAADYDLPLEECAERWDSIEGDATLMVLVDGLAARIAALIESLFVNFGLVHNFIGGGAGSLSFERKPCLLTPSGLVQDAALLIRLPLRSGVGVAHGWQPVSEPMKVTDSQRNQVYTLDGQAAFEQYRQRIEARSADRFGADNFFDIAKSYPLGVVKLGAEMIVRDPLMRTEDGKGMVCVGEVPEGCTVRLLNGTAEGLIAAAGQADRLAQQSWQQQSESTPEAALFIDCISRVLFLGDRITEELEQVAPGLPVFGALTLGEIANTGRDYLEFYNKTAVLGLLGRD
jgi:hypothetical protein